MVGPAVVRYFSVAAATFAEAIRIVSEQLGNPSAGEFRVARARGKNANGPARIVADQPVPVASAW